MELKHLINHEHPLIFDEEWSDDYHKASCSGCGELLLGASFNCMACSRFHLHKQCAEAPVELNHPFHREHSLTLHRRHHRPPCNFCGKTCVHFFYHCSCQIDLHIKCALFTCNLAEKKMVGLQHIAHIDPLICTKNHDEKLLKANCFICWKPLLDCVYLSLECGFFLHAKCVDLSLEINHHVHPQHQLLLQFNSLLCYFTCKICDKYLTQIWKGLSYYCSPCDFFLHIDCATIPTQINPFYHRQHSLSLQLVDEPFPCLVCEKTEYSKTVYFCSTCKVIVHIDCTSLPLEIKDKTFHEHPFVLFHRHKQIPLICDGCGTSGNYVLYFCFTCGLLVHKKCISLPRVLKHPMHPEHPIFHSYFLEKDKVDSWECRICHLEDVNPDHGSYYCSKCKYISHVNCTIDQRYEWYEWHPVKEAAEEEEDFPLPSYSIINETKDGENMVVVEIKHFSHDQHNLLLSNDAKSKGNICCDGCSQFIFTSYYYCSSQCNFFLHKHCAELPKKKSFWFHRHANSHPLSSEGIFKCDKCDYINSGFHYSCDRCRDYFCVRCALVSDIARCEGHKHPLPFYPKFEGTCNACGGSVTSPYRCKRCNFNLHEDCLKLPVAVQHISDEHLLKLTYGDNNVYSEYNYCDICEEERNPNHWFYHCTTCNNSAHVDCILNRSNSFIKLGSTYKEQWWWLSEPHEHDLIFVQKAHLYPNCNRCGKPCLNRVGECKELGCNYITHLDCVLPLWW